MRTSTLHSIKEQLYKNILLEKLNNPFGYGLVLLLSSLIAVGATVLGLKTGILLLAAIVAIPTMVVVFLNEQFGLAITIVIAFLIQFVNKFAAFPAGILLDALVYFMSFAIIVKQIKERDWSFAKNPISLLILLWVAYSFLQLINPIAQSRIAWVFTVRSMAGLILLYFVACYSFSTLRRITWMLKFILFLGFLSALYGLKQEWIGFSQAELNWLYADPKRFQLIVQWGRFRVFSLFSDPTTFGILMAYLGTFCVILLTGPFRLWKKAILLTVALSMFLAMMYGGSRTPVVLVPAGLFFFMLLTLRRNILIGAGLFFVLGAGMMLKSSSNPVLYRIQSAFKPGNDASVQVRLDNQALVQPYIQRHPFGAGMGSTGVWGKRFTPNSWLASFAHDSGFVRIAVEMGWIGLILYMALLFKILQTGIYYYLRVQNPTIKVLYLGLTTILFVLTLASYPQEAIVLLPTSIIFYICLAALVRLKDFDTA